MNIGSAILTYSPFVVFALSFTGFAYAWLRGRKRDTKETLANFGIWGVNQILRTTLTGGVMLAVLTPFALLTPLKLPSTWWAAVLTLLVADFIYYWKHRWSHEVRGLWMYHSVHHSSKEFNLSTAIRLPWLGTFTDSLFYIPAVLLGFSPIDLVLGRSLVLLYQYWIHSESIGRLGFFDKIFNSPMNHRVHHASNGVYLDKNHGGILIIWDRMFGTYKEETKDQPIVYGLTKPLNTYSPIMINFDEPLRLVRDLRQAKTFQEAWGYIFKKPGWQPG